MPGICAAHAQRGTGARQTAPHGSSATDHPMAASDAADLSLAIQAYEAGNLEGARPTLLRLATKYPQQAEIQAATGMTLAESGQLKLALPYLQRAHRLSPKDMQVTSNLAVALLKDGDATEAVSLLTREAAQQPEEPEVTLRLAQAQMQAGQAAAAAASYARCADLLQKHGMAVDDDLRHDWAVALLAANDPVQAVTVLQASAEQASSAPLQEMLGEAEERSQHFEAAVQHFKQAAQLDPSDANLYSYAAELMRHWTFPAAIQVLTYASQRYPASDRLQAALGIAFYGNADYEKAVPIFAGLLARDPNSSTAADLLGRSCSALGGAQQNGCTSLQAFAEAHPANAQASLYAGEAILHQPADKQDAAEAEKLLQNALRVNPALANGWYQLAVLQQAKGNWAGSADLLQHALQERPDFPEAHYRLSRAYSHLGKRDDAQKEIALQQKYAGDEKAEEQRRMKEVTTFLVTAN